MELKKIYRFIIYGKNINWKCRGKLKYLITLIFAYIINSLLGYRRKRTGCRTNYRKSNGDTIEFFGGNERESNIVTEELVPSTSEN